MLNDVLRPAKMSLRWSLLDSAGKAAAAELSGKIDYDMASGDLKRDEFSFTLPTVDKRTKFTLDLRLEDSGPSASSGQGTLVYGEQQDIEVWPDVRMPVAMPGAQAALRQCLLLDPKGKTAEVLTKAGMEFTKIDSLAFKESEAINPEKMLVVVGEDALTAETPIPSRACRISSTEAGESSFFRNR